MKVHLQRPLAKAPSPSVSLRTAAAVVLALSVLLLAGFVGATVLAQRNIVHARAVDRLVIEVNRSALELTTYIGDVVLDRSQSSVRQWRQQHESLIDLLNVGAETYPDISSNLTELSASAKRLADIVDDLVAFTSGHAAPGGHAAPDGDRELLISRLNREAQALASGSQELQAWAEAQVTFASRLVAWLSFLTLAGVAVLVVAVWLGWNRLVLVPLFNMRKGIERLSEGDWDHHLDETGGAEFREVAQAFNAMARRLATTTVSRDELQAEVEIRRKAETALTRSNEELEQFAYVASHDLQEPLRAVSSYVQLLDRRYAEHFDDKGREYMGYVVDGAHRMSELINDLLAYSRVTTRGEPMAEVDSGHALETAKRNLQIAVEESGAKIRNGELPRVFADEGQLVHVFQNLLANAIKFRSEEVPVIDVEATRLDGFAHFIVTDNGIGMEPRYKDRIFNLFQRLHGRDEYPGSGLGLALSKRIVERHDGKIWVESAIGEGSAFHFTIPTEPREAFE